MIPFFIRTLTNLCNAIPTSIPLFFVPYMKSLNIIVRWIFGCFFNTFSPSNHTFLMEITPCFCSIFSLHFLIQYIKFSCKDIICNISIILLLSALKNSGSLKRQSNSDRMIRKRISIENDRKLTLHEEDKLDDNF